MQRHTASTLCYQKAFKIFRQYSYIFLSFSFFYTVAYAQETALQTALAKFEVEGLSNLEVLNKAKALSQTNQQIITALDNEALRVSQLFNNEHDTVQTDSVNNTLLPVAKKLGDELLVARILIIKGNNYYSNKRYEDAIQQFTYALKYLSGDDRTTKLQLGETYKIIAQSYKRLEKREKTVYFYKKTLDAFTAIEYKSLIARTLNTLAEAERYLGNLVVALDYSMRGLEIHEQIDDPEGEAKALTGAGMIYRHIGRYDKSLIHMHKAYLYYKKENNANGIAETSNQLGFIYTRLKQFDQAKSFYQRSIDIAGQHIKPNTLAAALREMAVIDLNSDEYDSAMAMAKQANKIYERENEKSKESRTTRLIGKIYRDKKDAENAIAYYKESLLLATLANNNIYQIKAQTALAGMFIGSNTEEAISLLKKSLATSILINNDKETLYAYRNLRKAEKSLGNIDESLRYAEKELKLIKIIQKEKDDNKLVLMKANLHSYKMEIELGVLREKTKFDQLELAKKINEIEIAAHEKTITELENRYANIALALIIVICVFLVAIMYRRFKASKKHNKELDYLASRDPLTNCYNRRFLFEQMKLYVDDLEEFDEYCIIMADIDHFKAVNDTHGHSTGDIVICGVANALQSCVRKNDIVARFGGEEFCIILHHISLNQAMLIAEKMRDKVESSRFNDIAVTSSFGVISNQLINMTPAELIEQADLALYKSKSLGRNKVTLWDETLEK